MTNRIIRRGELIDRGIFTLHDWAKATSTGYIGAVKAPHIVKQSHNVSFVYQDQLDEYHKRRERWRKNYYNGKRTSQFIGMPVTDATTWNSDWLKKMLYEGLYMGIRTPLPYRFEGVPDVHYHIADLSTMSKFTQLLYEGKLTPAHPTFDADTRVYSPKYTMPNDEEFFDRYTQCTKELVLNRSELSEETIAAYRHYREGSKDKWRSLPKSQRISVNE